MAPTHPPRSIAAVAAERLASPDWPLCEVLSGFLDAFYEVGGCAGMLADEPSQKLDHDEAAFLAGAAEYLSSHYEMDCPA